MAWPEAAQTNAECYHFTNSYYKDPLNPFIGRGHFAAASVPGSHPAFRTASDEKLDESLGNFTAQRKPILSPYECLISFYGPYGSSWVSKSTCEKVKNWYYPEFTAGHIPAVVYFLGAKEENFIFITVVTGPLSLSSDFCQKKTSV